MYKIAKEPGKNYLQVFPLIGLGENEGSTLIRSRRKKDVFTGQDEKGQILEIQEGECTLIYRGMCP